MIKREVQCLTIGCDVDDICCWYCPSLIRHDQIMIKTKSTPQLDDDETIIRWRSDNDQMMIGEKNCSPSASSSRSATSYIQASSGTAYHSTSAGDKTRTMGLLMFLVPLVMTKSNTQRRKCICMYMFQISYFQPPPWIFSGSTLIPAFSASAPLNISKYQSIFALTPALLPR